LVRKFVALVLLVLAASPFTAPFGPCISHVHPLYSSGGISTTPAPDDGDDAGLLIAPILESGRVEKHTAAVMLPIVSWLTHVAGRTCPLSTTVVFEIPPNSNEGVPSVLRI